MSDAPIERRADDLVGVTSAKVYLFSAVLLAALTLVAFVAIIVAQMVLKLPLDTKPIYLIAWLIGPIIVALFGMAGVNVLKVLNGQQAMLIRVVAEKERAQGVIQGLKENPNIPIS